jgi:salicylate biosynthesis isochorismate synthase/menaquinone-specific isochorismate synthase
VPLTVGHDTPALLERRAADGRIASVTVEIDPATDVAAAVLAARRPTDRWFCFEQPDRDGYAVCGLGAAAVVEASGPSRFAEVADACRRLGRGAQYDRLGLPGAGPVFVGGFSFAPAGGRSPEWESFAPAQMVLPEVSFARFGARAALTVTALGDPAPALARLDELSTGTSMPLIDPDPAARPRVVSEAPPEHFEEAVRRAVERIELGELEKIVLARIVRVHAGHPHDAGALFGALREVFPSCYSFCVGTPEAAFVGASPELLVRRDGARAQTVALAGTTRRSADPAVDDHLGEQLLTSPKNRAEQAIVAQRIERTLEPVSVWVAVADRPTLVKVHNVQHLGTPIRAQLAEPLPVLELAGRLHPTPAVGGEPGDAAERLIPALEGIDRGWYAGAVGWSDLEEDGELCVAIRCALVRGEVAHLFAGNGIVADSDPADELAETEAKLQALLPLLA